VLTFGVAALTYLVVHVVSSLMIDSDLHINYASGVKPQPFSKRGDLHVCPHLGRVDAGQIFLKKFSATCSQYGTLAH
jgi:hypothetical protein